jgi:hypothetical protein
MLSVVLSESKRRSCWTIALGPLVFKIRCRSRKLSRKEAASILFRRIGFSKYDAEDVARLLGISVPLPAFVDVIGEWMVSEKGFSFFLASFSLTAKITLEFRAAVSLSAIKST